MQNKVGIFKKKRREVYKLQKSSLLKKENFQRKNKSIQLRIQFKNKSPIMK